MFQKTFQPYLDVLDKEMRQLITDANLGTDFDIMLRYPLGWVDENDQPYSKLTGKRLRPILLFLCTEAANGNWKNASPAGVAVEILHNFSLIHDDIQDDSPLRHNRPTVWKIWGIADAINAGDTLFTLAYTALSNLSQKNLSSEHILTIWQLFNQTNLSLTHGQYLDMSFEKREMVSTDEYIKMIKGKSASLLLFCAQVGSFIASHDQQLARQFADFGRNIGISFQIRDDILGIWGDAELTGKSTATDILARKKSLPILYTLPKSKELQELYQKAEDFTQADVDNVISILDDNQALNYTRQQEEMYYHKAIQALDDTQLQNVGMTKLKQFVDMLFGRTY